MDIFEHLNLVIAFIVILYWFIKSLGEKAKRPPNAEEQSHVPPGMSQGSQKISKTAKSQAKKIELQDRTFQSNIQNSLDNQLKNMSKDSKVPLMIDDYHLNPQKYSTRSKILLNRLPSKKDLLAYSVIFGHPKALNPRINDLDHSS